MWGVDIHVCELPSLDHSFANMLEYSVTTCPHKEEKMPCSQGCEIPEISRKEYRDSSPALGVDPKQFPASSSAPARFAGHEKNKHAAGICGDASPATAAKSTRFSLRQPRPMRGPQIAPFGIVIIPSNNAIPIHRMTACCGDIATQS